MLAGAESQVANIRVRSQGTLGGNLCFNDPHSDPATVLLVHDASVTDRMDRMAARQMPLQQFLRGMYSTALEPDELLVSDRRSAFTAGVRQCLFAHSPSATADAGPSPRPCRAAMAPSKKFAWRWDASGPWRLRLTELEAKIQGVASGRRAQNYSTNQTLPEENCWNRSTTCWDRRNIRFISPVFCWSALSLKRFRDVERKQDGKNG